jgi:integrase/recombinase XerD
MTPHQSQQKPTEASNLVHLPEAKPVLSCTHCNSLKFVKRRKDHKGDQIYLCKSCGRHFVYNPQKAKDLVVNPEAECLKDIWDCRCFGVEPGVGRYTYKLNFTRIVQTWLLDATKLYIKFTLATTSYSSASSKLLAIQRFSLFLEALHPSITSSGITRSVILDFLAYLAGMKLSASTKRSTIGCLRGFLDMSYQNQWMNVSRYLVRSEDFPKQPKSLPRYIPEEVIQQLNQHLDSFWEPIMRMVLVIQECGMRVSELLHLKFDCLLQDKAGDWFLKYYQFKMKKEITIPISREAVLVIQEQQRYIRTALPENYEYLFCANSSNGGQGGEFRPRAKPMGRESFNRYLNKVAKKHDIRTASGEPWHFQSHQFRHTVGTRMINNGVPQHIVQRYLGHESPAMTATYAHIHDQTMKKEIAKFQGKVVNIAGQVVESNTIEADDPELQWVKRSIQAQVLPNGSCALPTISKGCPHANACLTCTHFRTSPEHLPTHKREQHETEKIIEKAKANGWDRMVEMNEQKLTNLNNIIAGLEGGEDGRQA